MPHLLNYIVCITKFHNLLQILQAQEAELKKQLDETIAKRKMEQEVRKHFSSRKMALQLRRFNALSTGEEEADKAQSEGQVMFPLRVMTQLLCSSGRQRCQHGSPSQSSYGLK